MDVVAMGGSSLLIAAVSSVLEAAEAACFAFPVLRGSGQVTLLT